VFIFIKLKGESMNRLRQGAKGEFSAIVDDSHTASAMGNPGVNVLATPAVAWLFEGAASAALIPVMKEGEISVGTSMFIRHLKPTPPGMTVRAVATLRESRGNRYVFDVQVTDEVELVADGTIERAFIDKERFEKTVEEKIKPIPV